MDRDKPIDTNPRLLLVNLAAQLLPGTFEHAVDHRLDYAIDQILGSPSAPGASPGPPAGQPARHARGAAVTPPPALRRSQVRRSRRIVDHPD